MVGVSDAGELLTIAVDVVRGAADLVLAMRTEAIADVSTKSTRTDVVTAADRAAEAYVIDALRTRRPGDAVLGEESGEHSTAGTGTAGARREGMPEPASEAGRVRWILDPIDGTVNYLYGLPQYAVSLAAERDGLVVAGVVRNAATGEQWTAVRGGGAYRSGHRLACSAVTELSQTLVATGFGYAAARRAHQARVLAGLLPLVRDIRRFGAASLDLCFAAEGRFDAYFEKGLSAWDHAAGGLVAAEAGLVVSGLAGQPPGPDLVLAAPPGVYRQLHDALVAFDAAGGP
ncbi:MAG: inositol monophosphatase [Micromonosporaceae bacterium]|nr:inositol monophosphatase [Micromonosporaceae bacterium]